MNAKTEDFDIPSDIAAIIDGMPIGEVQIPTNTESSVVDDSDATAYDNKAAVEKMIVKAKDIPNAKMALNGLFRHPPEFTEEEWKIIAMGLQACLPLYAIAQKVHCSRHFLSRKIQENPDMVQVLIDSKETRLDIIEYQMFEAARSGSVAAGMYMLDHLGQERGYGNQEDKKESAEEIQINFGEIPEDSIKDAQKIIKEAEKQTTPTLAAELEKISVPKSVSPQDLAMAEDMVNAINKHTDEALKKNQPEIKNVQANVSPPPYGQQGMSDERYSFLDSAFSGEGESPFGSL